MLWNRFPIIGTASKGIMLGSNKSYETSGPMSVTSVGLNSIESECDSGSRCSGRWAIPIKHNNPILYVLLPIFSPTNTLQRKVATLCSIWRSNHIKSAFGNKVKTFNFLFICSGNASIQSYNRSVFTIPIKVFNALPLTLITDSSSILLLLCKLIIYYPSRFLKCSHDFFLNPLLMSELLDFVDYSIFSIEPPKIVFF